MPRPTQDLTGEIIENAKSPKSASQDGGSVTQQSIADLILADRYAKSQSATRRGLGFRRVQLRPGGNADLDRQF